MPPQSPSTSPIIAPQSVYDALRPLESPSCTLRRDVEFVKRALASLSTLLLLPENKLELHRILAVLVLWSENLADIIQRANALDDLRPETQADTSAAEACLRWSKSNRAVVKRLKQALWTFNASVRERYLLHALIDSSHPSSHLTLTNEELPLEEKRELDRTGSYARVDEVYLSGVSQGFEKTFARKLMVFHRGDLNERVLTEIQIIKKLRHRHIVPATITYELESTPMDRLTYAIIMPVVADCNLKDYLNMCQSEDGIVALAVRRNLQTWLGCLAVGLAYIHDERVRHMDVKPANVLVKGNQVLYADFGISKVFKYDERTTTFGPGMGTRMYCAPEALGDEDSAKNAKTDIFSLGCVYMEMLTVLFGKSVVEFEVYRGPPGNRAYSKHINESLQWLDDLRRTAESRGIKQNLTDQVFPLCNRMTMTVLRQRPSSKDVAQVVYGQLSGVWDCFCTNNFSLEYHEMQHVKSYTSSTNPTTPQPQSHLVICGPECCHRKPEPFGWQCCQCQSFNLLKLCRERCSICGHYRDDWCRFCLSPPWDRSSRSKESEFPTSNSKSTTPATSEVDSLFEKVRDQPAQRPVSHPPRHKFKSCLNTIYNPPLP